MSAGTYKIHKFTVFRVNLIALNGWLVNPDLLNLFYIVDNNCLQWHLLYSSIVLEAISLLEYSISPFLIPTSIKS
jgi:hypothetical protein